MTSSPFTFPAFAASALMEQLRGRRVVALTGAGCSTESGIPDYRGPTTRERARTPLQHKQFVSDERARARYWARSLIGWPRFAQARPNPAHTALARLERAGALVGLITQNVDGLHTLAGSERVVELHGALRDVRCLGCGALEPRARLQERLLALNPGWAVQRAQLAPDGDAELADHAVAGFRVADCLRCGGALKPSVVFFGAGVPRPVVDDAFRLLEQAEALLVVGTSLSVFSGLRFVRAAAQRGIPIGLINLGPTRGDDMVQVRVDARCGEVLPTLVTALVSGAR